MDDGAFKVCPFCKEKIRASAIKCRYCAEWLEPPVETPFPEQPESAVDMEAGSTLPGGPISPVALTANDRAAQTPTPSSHPLPDTGADMEAGGTDDASSGHPFFPIDDEKYMPPEMRGTSTIEDTSPTPSPPDEAVLAISAATAETGSGPSRTARYSPAATVPDEADKSNVTQKRGGRAYVYIAWFLLALQTLALTGMLLQAKEHHAFSDMLSNIPSRHISATILGLMLGSNFLTIIALLLGLVAWVVRRNMAAKRVIAVGLVLILITTVVAFLLDTAAPLDSQKKQEARRMISRIQDQWSAIVESSPDPQTPQKRIDTASTTIRQAHGELGQMEILLTEFMDRLVSFRNGYTREIAAIGWDQILNADRIKADSTFAESKVTVSKAREIVKRYTEQTYTLLSDTRNKIQSLVVSEVTKSEMLSGFDKGMDATEQDIRTLWSLEAKIIDEFEDIINLLSTKKGQWVVTNGQIRFFNDTDLDRFNSHIASIHGMAQRQQQIQQQSRQYVDRNFDEVRQVLE